MIQGGRVKVVGIPGSWLKFEKKRGFPGGLMQNKIKVRGRGLG